jgi:hypothetical protein
MELFDEKAQGVQKSVAADLLSLDETVSQAAQSKGSSILEADFNEAMNQSLSDLEQKQPESKSKMGTCQFAGTPMCKCNQSKSGSSDPGLSDTGSSSEEEHHSSKGGTSGTGSSDDHNHAPDISGNRETHVSLDGLEPTKTLNASRVTRSSLGKLLGRSLFNAGDILDGGKGDDTVIGSRGSDIIFGDQGGINTITTGSGKDAVILGKETTNRIFDFDPNEDKLILTDGLTADDIMITQGKNPGKGGLNQPLDSSSNSLIVDKTTGHILGTLTFTNAESLSEKNFGTVDARFLSVLRDNPLVSRAFKQQEGDGKLTGTRGRDHLVGGDGEDFLYVGNDGFKFNTAKGIDEFPFPTSSPGSSELNVELKDGVLRLNGTYKDFDGLPLFSEGEKEIDPNAEILNGSDPKALIEGFLRVPQDVEGNSISGTHLHFSPAGDSRGNFADATVVRFLENTSNEDKKSGTIKGEFELTPEEQAALLAGNLYVNIHTNIDGDGDGKAGFPTGENRININRDVVRFV